MSRKQVIFTILSVLVSITSYAQKLLDSNGNDYAQRKYQFARKDSDKADASKVVPIEVRQWKINEQFGDVIPTVADTVMHGFQNAHFTYGRNGEYNTLGGFGSPRLSRIYMNRTQSSRFLFTDPYSYWYTRIEDFYFTNTKSPYTNITYQENGSKENGDDRIRAYFATNINKKAGIGFKLDYLYGRGFYDNQATSFFDGSLYGYYLGDQYDMHAWFSAKHMKMNENGGIEDDEYILHPESFTRSFQMRDIPTNLQSTWNRNDSKTFYLNHHYNLGFYRSVPLPDSLRAPMPKDSALLAQIPDSVRQTWANLPGRQQEVLDSLKEIHLYEGATDVFVPVSSVFHTLKVENYRRIFQTKYFPESFYLNDYYGTGAYTFDETKLFTIKNTLGLQLKEGFNKWAQAGLTAFATYELNAYKIPSQGSNGEVLEKINEHNFLVGGRLERKQGKVLHYDVLGQVNIAGEEVGSFKVDGKGELNFKVLGDTAHIKVNAAIQHQTPAFYYRHYHGRTDWWDNELDKELRTTVGGEISWEKTRTTLRANVENITNYTYFAAVKAPVSGSNTYSTGAEVKQEGGSIQVITAQLLQHFKWGILNWENELSYQLTSDDEVLPLPTFNAYSNLYLKFKIAHVLSTEFGVDGFFFTKYYLPDYNPAIGQFTNQAEETKEKQGGKPVCSVYINFHLKHCRFYVQYSHITGNKVFLAPHYPITPAGLQFGLSWNFFN